MMRRLLWFAVLYAGGVAAISLVAFGVRLMIG
jgi:hypothetical protein